MGEREVFRMIRSVWQCQQLQHALTQQVITLVRIAALAGRYHVGPLVLATSRNRYHMITTQVTFLEQLAAVEADILVSSKQCTVGQRWFLPDLVKDFAFTGNDAV